jgi:hypothetical protein
MASWETIKTRIGKVTNKVVSKTEEVADTASKHVKLKTIEGNLSEKYELLGRLAYRHIKGGEVSEEKVNALTAQISSLLANKKQIKAELEAEKARKEAEKQAKKDALAETGRLRLRPILMTTLTTILGMSTMALAQGMGAEMMQPMAVVTIGGLSYATLMTLFVVPCMYDLINGEKMNAREIQMAKEAAGMARGDELIDREVSAPEVPAEPEVPAAPGIPVEPEAPAAPKVPEIPVWTAPAAPAQPAAPVQPPVHPAQGYPYGYPPYGYPAPRRTSPSRRAANRDRVRRRRDKR